MRGWFIYTLRDPRDGRVRYVGVSYDTAHRLRQHLQNSKRPQSSKDRWVCALLACGLKPEMDVVESGRGRGRSSAEKRWIKRYRDAGAVLVKGTPGGGWDDPVEPATIATLVHEFERIGRLSEPGPDIDSFALIGWFEAHYQGFYPRLFEQAPGRAVVLLDGLRSICRRASRELAPNLPVTRGVR